MLELAECPARYEHLAPGETLLESDEFVLFLAPGDDARSCLVQRPRFSHAGVLPVVQRARDQMRDHGRRQATWEIMSSVHSLAIVRQLAALGMQPSEPAQATIMALSSPPPAARPGIQVSAVDTLDDLRAHVSVTHEVFGLLHRLPAELDSIATHGIDKLADRSFVRYLVRVDGVPAGAATAIFTRAGVMLHSGSTLPAFRGRGIYAATVARRWHDAVARGTPRLVTRAGPMSGGVLRRLGFAELGDIHFLVDSLR